MSAGRGSHSHSLSPLVGVQPTSAWPRQLPVWMWLSQAAGPGRAGWGGGMCRDEPHSEASPQGFSLKTASAKLPAGSHRQHEPSCPGSRGRRVQRRSDSPWRQASESGRRKPHWKHPARPKGRPGPRQAADGGWVLMSRSLRPPAPPALASVTVRPISLHQPHTLRPVRPSAQPNLGWEGGGWWEGAGASCQSGGGGRGKRLAVPEAVT